MNNTVKKTLAAVIALTMAVTGMSLLASCSLFDKATNSSTPDSSVNLTQDTGASDGSAAETTAATPPPVLPSAAPKSITVGGVAVTATEFDFYFYLLYQQYSSYAAYGAVPTVAADGSFDLEAICGLPGFESKTWKEYLISSAIQELQNTYILAASAEEGGMKLSDASTTTINNFFDRMTEGADSYKMSMDEFLSTIYGATATKETLTPVIERYLLANVDYANKIQDGYTFTDAELQAYFELHKDTYQNEELPTVRHILFLAPKGVQSMTDATEEETAKAKKLADDALASINSLEDMIRVGDAAIADGTATEANEYPGMKKGDMVAEFENWSFDPARKPGDKAVVQTEYGFHVMYFIGTQKDWMADALATLKSEKFSAFIATQQNLPQFAIVIDGAAFERPATVTTTAAAASDESATPTVPATEAASETTKAS